jgi:hypothetical protein
MIFHRFVCVFRLFVNSEMMCREKFDIDFVFFVNSFSKFDDELSVSIVYHDDEKFIREEHSSLHNFHQFVNEQRHHEFIQSFFNQSIYYTSICVDTFDLFACIREKISRNLMTNSVIFCLIWAVMLTILAFECYRLSFFDM